MFSKKLVLQNASLFEVNDFLVSLQFDPVRVTFVQDWEDFPDFTTDTVWTIYPATNTNGEYAGQLRTSVTPYLGQDYTIK
ncbi:hypothetical protein HDV00_010938, partial [Rhizophlyctis rosea]